VIPVRLGADPYGFMGRYQGVQGKGLQPSELATKLVDILALHPRTAARFAEVVVQHFEKATQWKVAKELIDVLERFDSIPVGLLKAVEPALQSNVDLREAWGVPDRFRRLIEKHGAT
jgi:hypothetical protein